MIRLRIGQLWKREPAGAPTDSVGLLVEGVDLLTGASEEHLATAVPALVDGVHALVVGGQRHAQISLPASHLELLLSRLDGELSLEVVSLARPARLVRPAVSLDAEDLARAVVEGARRFGEDLGERLPDLARSRELRGMGRQLLALAGTRRRSAAALLPRAPSTLRLEPSARPGFAALLEDGQGRLAGWRKGGRAPLWTLLVPGTVSLHLAEAEPFWSTRGVPFLQALELAREGESLLRALDHEDPRFGLGEGAGPGMRLALPDGDLLRVGAPEATAVRVDPRALAAAMFTLGHELVVRIVERYRSQATNPYLVELSVRCAAGLAQLRPSPPPLAEPAPGRAPARSTPAPSAPATALEEGQLRALRFEPAFRRPRTGTEAAARRVLLGPGGPLLVGPRQVTSLDWDGAVREVREGSHGVAALDDGRVLAATGDRVLLFEDGRPSARWLRSHDGLPIGPSIWDLGAQLLTVSEERTLLAFCTVTGRELWRMAVPKTVRVFTGVCDDTVVLATDSGVLLGLDALDGQRRYQLRSRMGFAGPPRFSDQALLLTLHAGSDAAVVVAEAHTGAVAWMREGLALEHPTVPCAEGETVHVLGQRDQEAHLVALAPGGETRWDRAVPLGPPPYALRSWEGGVVAMSSDGTAARIDAGGKVLWRTGSAGEPQPAPLAPLLRRGVFVLPGQTVRAVEPSGGRVLAELPTEAPLVDLAIGEGLDLYLLDEEGTLVAHRMTSHLALLETA